MRPNCLHFYFYIFPLITLQNIQVHLNILNSHMDTDSHYYSMFHWLNIHNWREWNHNTLTQNIKTILYSIIQKILVSGQVDIKNYLSRSLHLKNLAPDSKAMYDLSCVTTGTSNASPGGSHGQAALCRLGSVHSQHTQTLKELQSRSQG